ncbi:Competence protein F [Bibersteinia trehalosi USDA-ARS-USMARC-190]|uniref:Competence protein F n=1 Tax=Bibersteinia trehalosi USDA-ARS-USMARC-190 TaxID=1263832 RepID=W0R9P1_BIBTR|nr:DNA utilization protein GntX [Bibersteinia trehalosi]AHG87030.1 Competence protein F [Bibersteinia trehalosi USDA-ARS-USMARC-190]
MNLFAFRCLHCAGPIAIASHGFCSQCVKLLEKKPYCLHCGSTLTEYQPYCGICLQNEPKWQRILQISTYKAPLTQWIQRFKFRGDYWLDQALARLLLLEILTQRRVCYFHLPEAILPVPLFWQRQWLRGYNQAELIARPLAKWLNIPLDTHSLQRIRATTPQRKLTARERRQNLRAAFRYAPIKPYQCVAIVDDVVTTGATLNAICAEVKKQGVREILVWTLARA